MPLAIDRRLLAMVASLCTLAVAGCGTDDDVPIPPLPGGGERWDAITSDLPDRFDPDSGNVCGRGEPRCIEAVVAEMDRRFQDLADRCHHAAPFALMYLRVTENVGGPGALDFEDPGYLNHLDAVFAGQYFAAIDAWRSGNEDQVPEAWALSFEAAEEERLTGLGDMLMGMNAHISRDLPFALERIGVETPDGKSAREDFDLVNTLLGDVQRPMIEEQSDRFDPGISDATIPALDVGADTFAGLMSRWRSEAFDNGVRLLEASDSERDRIAAEIEDAAAGRGRLIEALTSNQIFGPSASERRGYCESAGAGG